MKQMLIALLFSLILINLAILSSNCIEATDYTKEELVILIDENQLIKENVHAMAEEARALGWEEDSKLIKGL